MDQNNLEITLQIELAESDDDALDSQTRQLRQELLQDQPVEAVDFFPADQAPPGTKVAGEITLGVLLLAVAPGLLTQVLQFIQDWKMRREGRKIKLKIKAANGASIEIEAPETASSAQVRMWLSMVNQALEKQEDQG